jgi:hypothetical protein
MTPSNIEQQFDCQVCSNRGADVRRDLSGLRRRIAAISDMGIV